MREIELFQVIDSLIEIRNEIINLRIEKKSLIQSLEREKKQNEQNKRNLDILNQYLIDLIQQPFVAKPAYYKWHNNRPDSNNIKYEPTSI